MIKKGSKTKISISHRNYTKIVVFPKNNKHFLTKKLQISNFDTDYFVKRLKTQLHSVTVFS